MSTLVSRIQKTLEDLGVPPSNYTIVYKGTAVDGVDVLLGGRICSIRPDKRFGATERDELPAKIREKVHALR